MKKILGIILLIITFLVLFGAQIAATGLVATALTWLFGLILAGAIILAMHLITSNE